MKSPPGMLSRSICTILGNGIAGPIGGIVGGLVGNLLPMALAGSTEFLTDLASRLTEEAIQAATDDLADHLPPQQKSRINHDLQVAFRDSFREALRDIGGRECFPRAWRGQGRDVPASQVYPETPEGKRLWRTEDPLADQARDCLLSLQQALDDGTLLPLNPPVEDTLGSVYPYLESDTPQALGDAFFDTEVAPYLQRFRALWIELPGLHSHLCRHLLDRTLVHLGEFLKARPETWRAYNRHMLEALREMASGQQDEVLARLDALLDQPGSEALITWTEGVADLISATGRIEKQIGEGFETLTQRIVDQHRDVQVRFDELLLLGTRTEAKLDRMSLELRRIERIIEDGRHRTEDAPPVAPDAPPSPGEPPYQGLDYFREEDASRFFGRDALVARLAGHLRGGNRFLAVVGASGCGKSSVVRAGLISALRRGDLLADGTLPPPGSAHWDVRVLTPTASPLLALATALTRETGSVTAAKSLRDALSASAGDIDVGVRLALDRSGQTHMLLVVDQFEELFSACKDEEVQQGFVDALVAVAEAASRTPATVVIMLRADFYPHCIRIESLRELLEGNQVLVGPMTTEELREAIETPATQEEWKFERGVVELILRDVQEEPGALPLMSYALLQTWERRRGRTMLLESYLESGGVRGAISQTAEALYRSFQPEQKRAARSLLLRLTELGEGTPDTRRRAPLSELVPDARVHSDTSDVLSLLIDARLVTTTRQDGGEAAVEVAHEAVIQEWPTFSRWLEDARTWLATHRRLTEAAQTWASMDRDPGSLYRGGLLAQAAELAEEHPGELNKLEREFLSASKAAVLRAAEEKEKQQRQALEQAHALAEEQRRRATDQAKAAARLRRRAVFLGVSLLATVVVLVFAIRQLGVAQDERQRAEARTFAAQSVALADIDFKNSLVLAWRAVQHTHARNGEVVPEAFQAIYGALVSNRSHSIALGHQALVNTAVFSPDGQRLVTGSDDGTARLWDATSGALLATLRGHTGPVTCAAFSPDGELVVTAGWGNKAARVWSTASGALLATLEGHTGFVTNATFSPDGERVVTASWDETARVWDARSGSLLATLEGHQDEVNTAVFSPDGERVVTASDDGEARLWDAASGALLIALEGHRGHVNTAAFSSDGERVVTTSWDMTARVWDAASGTLLATLEVDGWASLLLLHTEGHTGPVTSATFSLDGERVVTAGWGNHMPQVWDSESGALLATLEGHTDRVNTAAFSPDGEQVVTASRDHTVRVWDSESGTLLTTLEGHTDRVNTVAFGPAGQRIVTASHDRTARVWDSESGALLTTLRKHAWIVSSAAYSPDGGRVVTASWDETARVWDTASGTLLTTLRGHTGEVNAATFSPDGQLVITASNDRSARMWDAVSGTPLATLEGHTWDVTAAVFSPDGERMVTASHGGEARVWDAASGALLTTLEGHTDGVEAAAFSPDGQRVVTASDSGAARVWDATSGTPLATLTGHRGGILTAAFSPDGKRVVTASSDATARVWDATSGTSLATLAGHSGEVLTAAFSPDGMRVVTASSDATARVWDGTAGALLATLEGHRYNVVSAAFSPDGKRVVTASEDRTARVWDAASGTLLTTLEGHTGSVNTATFSPNGEQVLTASSDHTARVWDISLASTLQATHEQLLPMLTLEECKQYMPKDCPPDAERVPLP